jgi:hypothetical protein
VAEAMEHTNFTHPLIIEAEAIIVDQIKEIFALGNFN